MHMAAKREPTIQKVDDLLRGSDFPLEVLEEAQSERRIGLFGSATDEYERAVARLVKNKTIHSRQIPRDLREKVKKRLEREKTL